jgi:hypothetical protein
MERSGSGAFLSLTDEGLPDKITPLTESSISVFMLKG